MNGQIISDTVSRTAAVVHAKLPQIFPRQNIDLVPAQSLQELWPRLHPLVPDVNFTLIPYENTPENAREILRNLEGVPFYGLALSENGIDLYRGADNGMVLASSPRQTWAFLESCAMMRQGKNGSEGLPYAQD